ncbi:MAG: hypothetical protein ACR2HR_14320 [Euzebya sp.]
MFHRLALTLVVLSLLLSACVLPGVRRTVDQEQARDLLTRAIGLTVSGQVDQLCTLSRSEASTCSETLQTVAGLAPTTGPDIVCVIPVGDSGPLRGGMVLVLTGLDGQGDAYTSEFVVFDDGREIGVLDPVYWSGLAIQSYEVDTVTWRFDSGSQVCQRGRLPGDVTPVDIPAPVQSP